MKTKQKKQTPIRCTKCRHNRLLHVTRVADGYYSECLQAWSLALIPNPKPGILNSSEVTVGQVEAYVCRQCGYTEFYTQSPKSLPVDGKIIREVVGPEEESDG